VKNSSSTKFRILCFFPSFKSGLPDGFFQTKNPTLGKFWRAL
jgi:hypothetical protein